MKQSPINIKNKRATFDYELVETFTSGIMLTGTEIKSIRLGKASLVDTYCAFEGKGLWVRNMHIAPYFYGSYNNPDSRRDRKLLLNKIELKKIRRLTKETGYTIIPVRMFINEKGETTITDINFQEREIKDHLIYEGPTDPTITGSFGNIFRYKNFRLNAFMTYSFGNVIRLDPIFSNRYSDLDATPKEFKNRWTMPGDENITNVPVIADRRLNNRYSQLNYAYNAYNYSSARIAKGDFIRLKEVSVSYDFPKDVISHLKMSDMSLKLQATNLFLIYADKKLNGQDPEFFNTGGVAAPVPKQFTLTLRFSL